MPQFKERVNRLDENMRTLIFEEGGDTALRSNVERFFDNSGLISPGRNEKLGGMQKRLGECLV